MTDFMAVSDAALAQARTDSAYRQRLLTTALEQLLAELNRQKQRTAPSPQLQQQLREGSLLAVRLADIIARLDAARPSDTAGEPPPAA